GTILLERVIVVAVLVLVVYLLVVAYQKFIDQQRVNSAVENAVNLIEKARSRTLSSQGGTSGLYYYIEVDSNTNRIVLRDQNGNTIETLDLSITPVLIEPPVGAPANTFFFAKSDCLPSNNDLRFERLTGDAKLFDGTNWSSLCATNYNFFTVRLKKNASGVAPTHTIKILNTGNVQIL
ncbi:MAG: hypothetical protein AAB482_04145, partial [Patescibacteria group bacterium]